MTEQEIIEGNKLIAEFMGYTIGKLSGWISGKIEEPFSYKKIDGECVQMVRVSKLKYHSSWDWLIPVVEKIYIMANSGSYNHDLVYQAGNVTLLNLTNSINVVWLSVVTFIKWYNENSSNK